ncbi:MAG: CDP-alcohol phosphatidyltransferase family protein [Phycisphaerales bacterium]
MNPSPQQALFTPAAGFRRWLPNALTILRLIIAFAFFTLLSVWNYPAGDLIQPVTPKHPLWAYLIAAALFGLAALTDAIDGPLARRWKVVSRFGRIMDPFADKVLVVGSFIMLAGPRFGAELPDEGRSILQVSGVMPWMAVLILGRELLVTSIRAIMEADGRDFSAVAFGKIKMIVQACVIPAILIILGITNVGYGTPGRRVIDVLVWITVAITALSGWPYAVRGLRGAFEPEPMPSERPPKP